MRLAYSTADVAVIDDFHPNPEALLAMAAEAKWGNYRGHDGVEYKRVSVHKDPITQQQLEAYMGRPVDMLGMAFRLNYEDELPNHAIHSDLGWGEWALVHYLSKDPPVGNGTAFWQHRAAGVDRIDIGQVELLKAIEPDWDRLQQWRQVGMVHSAFNRAALYRSSLFHSRWPFEGYGSSLEDGRLISVAFFT